MSFRYPRTAEQGTYKAQCYRCGKSVKHYALLKESRSGGISPLRVCDECWDELNPQDFARVVKDIRDAIPFSRPQPTLLFGTVQCTGLGRQALVGYAIVGCAVVDLDSGIRDMPTGTFDEQAGSGVITLG